MLLLGCFVGAGQKSADNIGLFGHIDQKGVVAVVGLKVAVSNIEITST
jgi:hypothetical protein